MKVGQLIKELSEYDPDMEVLFHDFNDEPVPVNNIDAKVSESFYRDGIEVHEPVVILDN